MSALLAYLEIILPETALDGWADRIRISTRRFVGQPINCTGVAHEKGRAGTMTHDYNTPADLDLHLIVDNYATHSFGKALAQSVRTGN